ncbi:DNA-processing protein DprA [uncultured Phocaeicola sp.]|uniref:DNA-processing protein DprA n=1 Tax=uncultured Phocaeicola sp. TaxID=990718 RepID=UPI0025EBA4F0|nr:DNA-processing protein DprA [uncultured Phocaeicola sp.]
MNTQETLYRLALPLLPGIGINSAHTLLQVAGSATVLFTHPEDLPDILPQASPKLIQAFGHPEILRRCEAELAFAEKNQITCLTADDEGYPSRLRECSDAPLVLFYQGNADLNSRHIISIVGTRNATDYGKGLCGRFIHDLQELLPDVIIVSGLAYGIDIHAHRAALQYKLDTVGVLAHGLDRIYPYTHRHTAIEMISHGGLLTEFMSGTNPDRQNFVKRNRIVAGISDATLVVESASKGGSLITAEIAGSYHRDCFAFPGRIGDTYSEGCNHLISSNQAALLQNAEELVKAMNWNRPKQMPPAIQRQLFPELNAEEKLVVQLMQKHPEGIQVNNLVVESNIPITRMTGILFELELKGVIRNYAGGVYRTI